MISANERREMRQELRRDVALMRKLGVASWNGIILGPPPELARDPVKSMPLAERMKKDQDHRMKVMFAATGTIPASLVPKSPDADVPRAVVTRASAETAHGRKARTVREG